MAATAAGELAAGRVVAGRYRVEGVIGRGGMGRVYRAVDEQLGRAVALKVLAVGADGSLPPEEAARRMLREARAAAAFSHPNAVAVFDVGDTVEGTLVGTPAYMAPEQLRGEKIDGRADQFAWAVTAWELLAGRKPWPATNAAELIAAVLSKPAPPLEAAGVSPSVAAAIARALSKPAGDRFVTMDALVAALDGDGGARAHAPVRLPRKALAGAVVAMAALVAAVLVVRAVSRHGTAAILRYPCAQPKSNNWECKHSTVAWCDHDGAQLACCAPGLVPVGRDGACACPPGGTSLAPNCAPPGDSQQMTRAMSAALSTVTQRCDSGESAYRLVLDVDPEGDVFDVHVRESADGNGAEQACVVDNARKLHFPPPPNGHIAVTLAPTEMADAPPPATAAPIRFVCPNDKVPACSQDHELAWCDREGHFLACCNESLVPLGHDGMCGCPKGGSTKDGSACPPPLHSKTEYIEHYLASSSRRAVRKSCGDAADRIGFDLVIDPDGRVYIAVIRGGATADERLQRCVLEALRKLEVDPPPDGTVSVNYGPVYLKEKIH
jgi:hypothetical protein